MFDLDREPGEDKKASLKSPIDGDGKVMEKGGARAVHKLDTGRMRRMHDMCKDYYQNELERQRMNRLQQHLDESFYDNEQWDTDDAATLEDRGQKPLVFNVISASIDWVTGTEKRTRTDFKILPRRKEASKPAQRKTALVKYLSDVNRTPFSKSRAFEDSVKVGVGWMEDGYSEESEFEPLYSKYESWRNMLWDSASIDKTMDDCRYMFRTKFLDLDLVEAMFEDRQHIARNSVNDGFYFGQDDYYGDEASDAQEMDIDISSRAGGNSSAYRRQRVRVIEGWIKIPVKVQIIDGGDFHGEYYDQFSRGHREALASGEAELDKRIRMRLHVAVFTNEGLLWFSESPYKHNRFPFTPYWGKRRGRDQLPYGIIRTLRDIQEDVNKRASKALYILSTNKVVMTEGAVVDIDDMREELARPDGVVEIKEGSQFEIRTDRDLADGHIELMGRDISLIQSASGITDENMGRKTNASSGIAIERRQDQGALATLLYFDNMRLGDQLRGEKLLSNIEQFMDDQKSFRITNQRGTPEFIDINDGLPENDISRTKADFLIAEADWQVTLRQAAVRELMDVMANLPPQVGMTLLDLIVENMDLQNRDEIVQRVRAMNNQRDPDEDENSPEAQERAAQVNAAAEHTAALAQLAMAKEQAATRKVAAEAARIEAQVPQENVKSQQIALDSAEVALSLTPVAAHTADYILRQAGFISDDEKQAAAEQEALATQQAEQAQLAQQQAQEPQQQQLQLAPPQAPQGL